MIGKLAVLALTLAGFVASADMSVAQTRGTLGRGWNEPYVPGIWIDPDGCEHWVMDDGTEGYMSPHRRRDGTPVCHRQLNRAAMASCGTLPADMLFASGSYAIDPQSQQQIVSFFRATGASAYAIYGHSDSVGSAEENMKLSYTRAQNVARIAGAAGVAVSEVRGYGATRPVASNGTAAGRAANRRVEIFCIR